AALGSGTRGLRPLLPFVGASRIFVEVPKIAPLVDHPRSAEDIDRDIGGCVVLTPRVARQAELPPLTVNVGVNEAGTADEPGISVGVHIEARTCSRRDYLPAVFRPLIDRIVVAALWLCDDPYAFRAGADVDCLRRANQLPLPAVPAENAAGFIRNPGCLTFNRNAKRSARNGSPLDAAGARHEN